MWVELSYPAGPALNLPVTGGVMGGLEKTKDGRGGMGVGEKVGDVGGGVGLCVCVCVCVC